jgi:hypothetical protein
MYCPYCGSDHTTEIDTDALYCDRENSTCSYFDFLKIFRCLSCFKQFFAEPNNAQFLNFKKD